MLHEVLLALSGHPSPILEQGDDVSSFPLVSEAETALLSNLGRLASIHRALKTHLQYIVDTHESALCRVVAQSIFSTQLSRFQKAILDVEHEILAKDPSYVGAYNIVPLASIVVSFQGWKRLLEWFWELACFILPTESDSPTTAHGTVKLKNGCDGAALLSNIRRAMQTGYPDIEEAAKELAEVAERTWLRQLCTWLILGKPVERAERDFFVYQDDDTGAFKNSQHLIPPFVTAETAASILNIGRICVYLKSTPTSRIPRSRVGQSSSPVRDEFAYIVQPEQLRTLVQLKTPVSPAALSSEISGLRTFVASKFAEELLPSSKIIETVRMFRQFLLGGRDDYADILVQEADRHLQTRHLQTHVPSGKDTLDNLAGLMLKENELRSVLSRTWISMASSTGNGDIIDDELEWAREHVSLTLSHQTPSQFVVDNEDTTSNITTATFNEFLMSSAISVRLQLDPVFDLIISPSDIQLYTTIHSFLLALRRAHNHIAALWTRGPLRRAIPRHFNPSRKQGSRSIAPPKAIRQKATARDTSLRFAWSTASSAVLLVDELGDYFTGEVIGNAWKAFSRWASRLSEESRPSSSRTADERDDKAAQLSPLQATHFSTTLGSSTSTQARPASATTERAPLPDPELLAQAHRHYLTSLAHDLLLTESTFTQAAKTLLQRIDAFVALITRLTSIQKNIDLAEEGVVEETSARNFAAEESDVLAQVLQTAGTLREAMQRVVTVLRELSNTDRAGSASSRRDEVEEKTGFAAWRTGGVERLLIRLDFGMATTGPASTELV